MATNELGSGKTVIILAVVVGCFGILWPRVFYPMMQTTFMATKPRGLTDGLAENAVCCGVIYENTVDLKWFAELCQSVINPGKAKRVEHPPEGTLERCRLKILELCDLDINELLDKKEKIKNYRIEPKKVSVDTEIQKPKLNLTQCLEKHFHYGAQTTRKQPKEVTLPSYMRQERSPRAPISGHPALMERGQQFQAQKKVQNYPNQGGRTVSGIRPNIGGKPELSTKGGNGGSGAMGFLMPIYTVGIVVFFIYTIVKVLLKKTQNESETKPKTDHYHVDPEYRKYLLSEQYHKGNMPISYQEYLDLKQHSEYLDQQEDECLATKLLSNGGRKQVARMDIDTRLDILRQRLEETEEAMSIIMKQMAAFQCNQNANSQYHRRWKEHDACDDTQTAAEELNEDAKFLSNVVEGPLTELSEHLKQLIHQQDSAKIAVMEMQNQEQKSVPPLSDLQPQEVEVSNIMLEKSVPSNAQLLVTESQCLTHTSVEHIDGWSECEDNPIVVTGKMTISLLGNEQMAVVNSTETEQASQQDEDVITPTPDLDEQDDDEDDGQAQNGGVEAQVEEEEEEIRENGIGNHVEQVEPEENNEPIEHVDHIEQVEQTNVEQVDVIREVNGVAHVSL